MNSLLSEEVMTNLQLKKELYSIKQKISGALIDEANRNGTETEFWHAIKDIWKDMNEKNY